MDALREEVTAIEIIIQPTHRFCSPNLVSLFLTSDFGDAFGFKGNAASNTPKIVIKRGLMDVPAPVKIYDHYGSPQSREYYDLSLDENKTFEILLGGRPTTPFQPGLPGHMIPKLNAPWLLRRQIRIYNECATPEARDIVAPSVKTMCEVLSLASRVQL